MQDFTSIQMNSSVYYRTPVSIAESLHSLKDSTVNLQDIYRPLPEVLYPLPNPYLRLSTLPLLTDSYINCRISASIGRLLLHLNALCRRLPDSCVHCRKESASAKIPSAVYYQTPVFIAEPLRLCYGWSVLWTHNTRTHVTISESLCPLYDFFVHPRDFCQLLLDSFIRCRTLASNEGLRCLPTWPLTSIAGFLCPLSNLYGSLRTPPPSEWPLLSINRFLCSLSNLCFHSRTLPGTYKAYAVLCWTPVTPNPCINLGTPPPPKRLLSSITGLLYTLPNLCVLRRTP